MEGVRKLKYLDRVMNNSDGDYLKIYSNLTKERKSWGYFRKILGGREHM